MNELDIPEAAVDAVALAIDPDEPIDELHEDDCDEIRTALTAAAPHLIAAELRRAADELEAEAGVADRTASSAATGLRLAARRLCARADEMDGGAQ